MRAEVVKEAAALGRTLRRLRTEREVSQETLAYDSGVSRTHISAIEKGQHLPTLDTLFKLARALNTSAVRILLKVERDPEALTEGITDVPGLSSEYLEEAEEELREIIADGDADEAVGYVRFKLTESYLWGMKTELEKWRQWKGNR